jgi:hypothetical protein
LSSPSEREFLELAGVYLKCRFLVMGGSIPGHEVVTSFKSMEWPMLGVVDYAFAMRDFVKKWKLNPRHSERYRAPGN